MKLFWKILAGLVIVTVILAFVLPILYEDEIVALAKEEINNNVQARVDFGEVNLSLLRHFPDFSLTLRDLTITGKDDFDGDTLADIGTLSFTIDLFSVISGTPYEIKRIFIGSPRLALKINKQGKANYDILPEEDSGSGGEQQEDIDETGFSVRLQGFRMENALVSYEDEEEGLSLSLDELESDISGSFSDLVTGIDLNLRSGAVSLASGGVNYLQRVDMRYTARINADLGNDIYTFGENVLELNELKLIFEGKISLISEGTELQINFGTEDNDLRQILSLIPAIYTRDFADLKAGGSLSVKGSVNGIYKEDHLPAFHLDLQIKDGHFNYPDLPGEVRNIQIMADISNPGGDLDNTIVNLPKILVSLEENPIEARLSVKTPISDPDIDAVLKGTIDLATVKNYYPLEDELTGKITTDMALKGRLSSIEKEEYEKFHASGEMQIEAMKYTMEEFSLPVYIPAAYLTFSPQYLQLNNLRIQLGDNNLDMDGKISNYLGYFLSDDKLTGNMNVRSSYLNVDEFLAKSDEAGSIQEASENAAEGTGEESSVVLIPDNINFVLNAAFDRLIYDELDMQKVKGTVIIKDQALTLKNLNMNTLNGKMLVNGTYSSRDPEKPKADLQFTMTEFDIPAAYNSFAVMRQYLPIARKTTGFMSVEFNLSTQLDQQMMPIYESMNGGGQIKTTAITINDLNTFLEIAEALNFSKIKNLELNPLTARFKFIGGKLMVNPFDIKYKDITANISGWTGFDQHIGYTMSLSIPRSELGTAANQFMDRLAGEAEKYGIGVTLPEKLLFDVTIEGTLTQPVVKTNLSETGNKLMKEAKEKVIQEISEEARQQAQKIIDEADRQAKKIIAEAERQAAALRNNADDAIKKLNAETDKQSEKLMAEAKKQGFLAEMAARETIKQLRKEADKKIEQLRNDADAEAEKLIDAAKKLAKEIRNDARKQADMLLKP